jgi:hypothetical protein
VSLTTFKKERYKLRVNPHSDLDCQFSIDHKELVESSSFTVLNDKIWNMSKIKFPSKPTFSGHETFALRQLWLRKAYDEIDKCITLKPLNLFTDENQDDPLEVASRDVFVGADAIQRFGVGKNMVSSIRHWALACDVIRESKSEDGYYVGEIGEFLFGENAVDEFLEEDATIWLVHWLLAGRAKRSATWFVLFNYIDPQSFQAKDVVTLIEEFAESHSLKKSKTTIARDVEVCIKCYAPVTSKTVTEDAAEPLLATIYFNSTEGLSTRYLTQYLRMPYLTFGNNGNLQQAHPRQRYHLTLLRMSMDRRVGCLN